MPAPRHPPPLRTLLLLAAPLALPGCDFATAATPPLVGAELASILVFQRGLLDLAWSGATGRDCSVVRLEQGKSYCRPVEPAPVPPPFCTRALGGIDCWTNPEALLGGNRQVADGPRQLTPAQEADRTRRWPNF